MPTITRRLLGGVALLLVPGAAAGEPSVNVLGGDQVAIHGHDPVAYFTDGGPRPGRPELVVEHGGARWLFASDANKRAFEREPGKYLPAYGGYCAYGVSRGYLVKIDPEAWSIVDGRLYLNYDKAVRVTWLADVPGHLRGADANWPALVGQP